MIATPASTVQDIIEQYVYEAAYWKEMFLRLFVEMYGD